MTALNKQEVRSREEFEEYYNETHAVKVTSQFKRFGYYVSPTMQKAWELWQKAQSSMRDELKSAEKRIAELESNEIQDDGNQFLVVRHPGKTPVIKHCSGDLEGFLRHLIEQDSLVTIDIITHRYYGVGGQWVQDADEYLHMMAAAGIGVKGE